MRAGVRRQAGQVRPVRPHAVGVLADVRVLRPAEKDPRVGRVFRIGHAVHRTHLPRPVGDGVQERAVRGVPVQVPPAVPRAGEQERPVGQELRVAGALDPGPGGLLEQFVVHPERPGVRHVHRANGQFRLRPVLEVREQPVAAGEPAVAGDQPAAVAGPAAQLRQPGERPGREVDPPDRPAGRPHHAEPHGRVRGAGFGIAGPLDPLPAGGRGGGLVEDDELADGPVVVLHDGDVPRIGAPAEPLPVAAVQLLEVDPVRPAVPQEVVAAGREADLRAGPDGAAADQRDGVQVEVADERHGAAVGAQFGQFLPAGGLGQADGTRNRVALRTEGRPAEVDEEQVAGRGQKGPAVLLVEGRPDAGGPIGEGFGEVRRGPGGFEGVGQGPRRRTRRRRRRSPRARRRGR